MSARQSFFNYTASAAAYGGLLTKPVNLIPTKATACLTGSGGLATGEEKEYFLDGVLSVKHAFTKVTGNDRDTQIQIAIEGIRLLNRLEVDRLVVNVKSTFPAGTEEAQISPLGSVIEGVRVDGVSIDLTSKVEEFSKYSTYSSLQRAYASGALKGLVLCPSKLGGCCDAKSLEGCVTTAGDVRMNLFEYNAEKGYFPMEYGGIRVKDFGTLYFGEFSVTKTTRDLTMLRVELGCDTEGSVSFGRGANNGHEEP